MIVRFAIAWKSVKFLLFFCYYVGDCSTGKMTGNSIPVFCAVMPPPFLRYQKKVKSTIFENDFFEHACLEKSDKNDGIVLISTYLFSQLQII